MSSKYKPSAKELAKLENDYGYHKPEGDQVQRYERINRDCKQAALTVLECCPPSPDRTVALRAIQEARMKANMSIACNEQLVDGELVPVVL
jgi:hypothetical protein